MSVATEDLEIHVCAMLAADATLFALLDHAVTGFRLYPEQAAQETAFPFVVYTRTNTDRNQRRLESQVDPLPGVRMEFEVFALSRKKAREVAGRLRTLLDAKRVTWNEVAKIQSSKVEDSRDSFQPPGDGSEVGVYSTTLDVLIYCEE